MRVSNKQKDFLRHVSSNHCIIVLFIVRHFGTLLSFLGKRYPSSRRCLHFCR